MLHPADMIFFWARTTPGQPAIIQPDMVVTYEQLADAIISVSERLRRYQFKKGQPVGVSIDNPVWMLAVCFALLRLGVVAAPVARGTLPFLRPSGIDDVIYAGEGQMLSGGKSISFDRSWMQRQPGAAPATSAGHPSLAAETDMIFFTSGTTGMPKKRTVPVASIMDRISMLPVTRDAHFDRVLVVPGLSSSFGFSRTAMLLYAGKTACFARDFGPQLAFIQTFGVEALVGSAQQILDLVKFVEDGAACQVDTLREVRIGGGFSSAALISRTQSQLCRNVTTEYGATEAGRIAIASGDMIADVPDAVGFVIPGVDVEIVDETNSPVPAGKDGVIRIRTNYFASVFAANNPESADKANQMWWYPGDLGRLTADGILCITGRGDDVINCGGVKLSGVKLDEIVRQFPGVKDVGVCGVRGSSGIDEVWIGIVPDADIDIPALCSSLEANQEFGVRPGEVLFVEKIPRNDLGKLQRNRLKEDLVRMKKSASTGA